MVNGNYCYVEAYGLGRLQDCAGREGGLMTAASALVALVPPAMDEPVILALTTVATETIRPARLLQGGLAFLLAPVELDEPGQRQAGLELDSIHGHCKHSRYMRTSLSGKGRLAELAT